VKGRLQLLLSQYIEEQQKTNKALEKIAALLVSNQLLQECVDHSGKTREADVVAELIADSYSAGLCLLNELEQRNKEFDYQKSEFFVDTKEEITENDIESF
jgi:predicted transcriptional regulator|tara:strand:- start:375 stop:677 length:303 start_codon:yes stop_codon:yes gene_type:complete